MSAHLNGEPLVPFLTGLVNHGSNSYMNAILQCLFHIKGLPELFFDPDFAVVYRNSKEMPMVRAFSRILENNYKNEYNDDTMWNFIMRFIQRYPEFQPEKQQNAYEFLTYFLRWLEDELSKRFTEVKRLKNAYEYDEENAYDAASLAHSMIKQCWIGLKNTTTCECNAEIMLEINQEGLSVEIGNGSSLNKCIANLFKPSKLEELFKCNNCKRHTDAIQFKSINQFPDILIVHLKLFSDNEAAAYNRKLHKNCPRIMKELELDMYADDDSAPELKSYYLFAVCMHSGETLQHGQFSSVCFNYMLNQWVHFDDDQVKEINGDLNDYVRKKGHPFILFYRAIPMEIPCAQICRGLSRSFSTFSIGERGDTRPTPRESSLNVEQMLALLDDEEPEATQILSDCSNDLSRSNVGKHSPIKPSDSIDAYLDMIVKLPGLQQNRPEKNPTPMHANKPDSIDEYMDRIVKMPEMQSNSSIVIIKGGAIGKKLELKPQEQCKPCYVDLGERVPISTNRKPRLSREREKIQKNITEYTTKVVQKRESRNRNQNVTAKNDDVIEITAERCVNNSRNQKPEAIKSETCTIQIPLKAIKNVVRKKSVSRIIKKEFSDESDEEKKSN